MFQISQRTNTRRNQTPQIINTQIQMFQISQRTNTRRNQTRQLIQTQIQMFQISQRTNTRRNRTRQSITTQIKRGQAGQVGQGRGKAADNSIFHVQTGRYYFQTGHAAGANSHACPAGNQSAPVAHGVVSRQAGVRGVTHPSVSDSDQNSAIRRQSCVVGRIIDEGPVAAVVRIKTGQPLIITGYYYWYYGLLKRESLVENYNRDIFFAFVERVLFYGQIKGGSCCGTARRKDDRLGYSGGIVRGRACTCSTVDWRRFYLNAKPFFGSADIPRRSNGGYRNRFRVVGSFFFYSTRSHIKSQRW